MLPEKPWPAVTRSLSRSRVQWLDERAMSVYGIPGIVLMENAGRGAAESLLRRGALGPVMICCGRGNNGGDGFVIARHLDQAGIDVHIKLFGHPERLTPDTRANYEIARRSHLRITEVTTWGASGTAEAEHQVQSLAAELGESEWIVDALLGTGAQGEITGMPADVIRALNLSNRPVLAIDLPSGLDADTGEPLGCCLQAAYTVTFVARKAGFDNPVSRTYTGEVEVTGIGIPQVLLKEAFSED